MTKKQNKQARCPHCGHKGTHRLVGSVYGDLATEQSFQCCKCDGSFETSSALHGRDWQDEPLSPHAMSAAGVSLAEVAGACNALRASFTEMGASFLELRDSVFEMRTLVRGILERETEREEQRTRDPWTKFKDMVKRRRLR